MKPATGEEEAEARDLSLGDTCQRNGGCHCHLGARAAREGLTTPSSLGMKGQRQTDKRVFTPGDRCFRTVIVTSCRNKIQDRINCSGEKQC